MRTRKASRIYPTEREARAFMDGLQRVNDSAIEELTIRTVPQKGFRVEWDDLDGGNDP